MTTPPELTALLEAERAGKRPAFVFFWGHTPPADGTAGPHVLSQWWPAPFTVDGRSYATAEHWMMWSKAVHFGDTTTASAVLADPDPRAAKALGREVSGFVSEVWARHRFDVVVAGNRAKFGQHPALRDYLLATGDDVLVEASPEDRIWGIGLGANDRDAARPSRWRGTNLLGFALMRVRAELSRGRSSTAPPS